MPAAFTTRTVCVDAEVGKVCEALSMKGGLVHAYESVRDGNGSVYCKNCSLCKPLLFTHGYECHSGLLDSPTQLATSALIQNQILTWTPPPTLDITDLHPDIIYRVCNNVTDTCVNTGDTSYIIPTTAFFSSATEYRLSACNPVGCSQNVTFLLTGR